MNFYPDEVEYGPRRGLVLAAVTFFVFCSVDAAEADPVRLRSSTADICVITALKSRGRLKGDAQDMIEERPMIDCDSIAGQMRRDFDQRRPDGCESLRYGQASSPEARAALTEAYESSEPPWKDSELVWDRLREETVRMIRAKCEGRRRAEGVYPDSRADARR